MSDIDVIEQWREVSTRYVRDGYSFWSDLRDAGDALVRDLERYRARERVVIDMLNRWLKLGIIPRVCESEVRETFAGDYDTDSD